MEVRYWEEKEEWDSLINDGGGGQLWNEIELMASPHHMPNKTILPLINHYPIHFPYFVVAYQLGLATPFLSKNTNSISFRIL